METQPDPASPPARRRRPGVLQALATVVVLGLLTWLGVAAINESPAAPEDASPVKQFAPAERTTVESFTGLTLQGDPFSSKSLLGKVVVYNVWGSWCVPCRTEIPELITVAKEFPEVQFVGINVREPEAAARAFERRYQVPYPSIRAADSGRALLAFGGVLTAAAVPATVVVDPEGRVAARVFDATTASTLRGLIGDVVAEG